MARPSIPQPERSSYSRLWQEFSAHLKELMRRHNGGELQTAKTAHNLGVHKDTLDSILTGGLMPSIELAERMVRYFGQGQSFAKAPRIRALTQAQARKGYVKVSVWISEKVAAEYEALALRWGLSEMALRSLALTRFAAHEPPWHSIKQVVGEVEAALRASYLQAHPHVQWVLDMELAWAERVGKEKPRDYVDPGLPLPHEELMRLGTENDAWPADEGRLLEEV